MTILDRLFKLVKNKVKVNYGNSKSHTENEFDTNKLREAIENLGHPELLEGLDVGQKTAVLSENPRTLVLAGAGAGKTRVLLYRIFH